MFETNYLLNFLFNFGFEWKAPYFSVSLLSYSNKTDKNQYEIPILFFERIFISFENTQQNWML